VQGKKIGQMSTETVERIEPARLDGPTEAIADVITELSAAAATLGRALHPRTAANLADLVRAMNCYYSNQIEGHDTRPREIERALAGDFTDDPTRRDLQMEAIAHIRLQAELDDMAARDALPPPADGDFLRAMHRQFYDGASQAMLAIKTETRTLHMTPGEWRQGPLEDVQVGNHQPPSSGRVAAFMEHCERRYDRASMGRASQIMAVAAAHHRFNYIHPFLDGNGRVSRLMSHAMAQWAGIGAHGLWSISRGLARGLESRGEYMQMMDYADRPRQGDRDGRGNLSEAALQAFVLWFLRVSLDQVTFMSGLFDLNGLAQRLRLYVERRAELKPQAARLLEEALMRGEFERGEIERITGLPERTARRALGDLTKAGLLASDTPKGKVSLRFPTDALEELFPRLYPQT
jgi:Fic family protein